MVFLGVMNGSVRNEEEEEVGDCLRLGVYVQGNERMDPLGCGVWVCGSFGGSGVCVGLVECVNEKGDRWEGWYDES